MPDILSMVVPELDRIIILISLALCVILGIFTYLRRVLDIKGSVMAVILGVLLVIWSDFFWFLLMLTFLFATYWVTMWKYAKKAELGLGEGIRGERGVKNVLANGLIPFIIAVLSNPLNELSPGLPGFLFIIAISVATADTFASEIGVLSGKARLITHPSEIVRPGVNGGVSTLGNIAAFIGALIISLAGFVLLTDLAIDTRVHSLPATILALIFPVVLGWIGCQIDSVIGATLQNKGHLSNNMVNFITILSVVLLTTPFYIFLS